MKKKIDISVLPDGVMLWRVSDVMKALSVCRATVYNLISSGQLRTVKIGRSTRFLPSDVKKLIEDNIY